jgi:type I restriction enzyme R subunit
LDNDYLERFQISQLSYNSRRIAIVAVQQLCLKKNLKLESVKQMIAVYKFSGKEPLCDTVLNACNENPKLLERKKIFDRVVPQLL